MAEFELEPIRERVTAGMDRAKREGKYIGRHKGTDSRKQARMAHVVPLLQAGQISWRQAAQQAGVALSTLQALMRNQRSLSRVALVAAIVLQSRQREQPVETIIYRVMLGTRG